MYTNIYITVRNTHKYYSPHLCNGPHDCGWYLQLLSSTAHSIFPLLSANTSGGHGSFPIGVTQTFISEESGPLELGCCSFSLTLIIEYRLRDTLRDLLYSRDTLPFLHWVVATHFPLVICDQSTQPVQ